LATVDCLDLLDALTGWLDLIDTVARERRYRHRSQREPTAVD